MVSIPDPYYLVLYPSQQLINIVSYLIVDERPNFPKEEEKVLQYWNDINAFHKQNELTEGRPTYSFFDGPPFATGMPHYGHIAAGTIKVSFH